MIKFFRKVRQKLLSENRFSKYLVYAVGEILLVVIGIIIALQLNNWNENRKETNVELQLYSNLLADLISESGNLENHISMANAHDQLYSLIYNETKGKTEYNPDKYYNYLLWFYRYNMFIKEKYEESLATITNKIIHNELKGYMRQEVNTTNSVNDWNDYQINNIRAYLNKYGLNKTEVLFNEESNVLAPIINNTNLIDHAKLIEQYGSQELDQLLFSLQFKTLWMAQNFVWLHERNRDFQRILKLKMSSTKLVGSFELIEPKTIEEFLLVEKTDDEIIEIITQEVESEIVFNFTEREINDFGYNLMRAEKYQDALTVFRLNTELYPNAWNTYDSYGECLLELGKTEDGLKAYKKSLELEPDNSTAKEVIERHKVE